MGNYISKVGTQICPYILSFHGGEDLDCEFLSGL
jgi:hypothetical protein